MLLSGAWGKVIHEKNLKQKISWHCLFKRVPKSMRCVQQVTIRAIFVNGNAFQLWRSELLSVQNSFLCSSKHLSYMLQNFSPQNFVVCGGYSSLLSSSSFSIIRGA